MRMVKVSAVAIVITLGLAWPASAQPVALGFENPESAAYDAESGTWFVSSMGGYTADATGRAGDGFISRVGNDGVLAEVFIDGLNAPKGLRLHEGVLYAVDVGEVVAFEAATGEVIWRAETPTDFVNDPAVDPETGDVYVTETAESIIYRIDGETHTVEVFVDTDDQPGGLEGPNGLLFEPDRLVVASVGPNFDTSTFQTSEPGRLLAVDLETKAITPLTERVGALDGLEPDGDGYLVSDFFAGRVLRVAGDGTTETVAQVLPGAADIGFDPATGTIAVPQLLANVVVFTS